KWFFDRQLGYMYFRYFLWNFGGRESDIEGANYLRPWEVSTKGLPHELQNNKGRNQYFWLPLFLGILGLIFHFGKDRQAFAIVGLLYLFTGIALVVFLNSPPVEPRERDYIYVGSYYAFAMWMGLGVLALGDLFKKLKNQTLAASLAVALGLVPPVIMAAQNWDDHDRSNRYHSVDSAKNLLASCAKNAILFTGGDNDTFPLWYVQEVEGFRTDVRVCNLSLLGTDWYVEQMKRKTYESAPLPIKFRFEQFIQGTNDQVLFSEKQGIKYKGIPGMNLLEYMELLKKDDPGLKMELNNNKQINILPTEKMIVPLDSVALMQASFIPENIKRNVKPYMTWDLPKNDIFKPDLMILEMIANNAKDGWKRPIYFSSTLGQSNYLNLFEYFQVEGLTYRLMPVKVTGATSGYVNTNLMYENMTKNMYWRELDNPKVYYDENYRRFPYSARLNFYRLASELYNESETAADEKEKTDKREKAKNAIKYCFDKMPDNVIPYDRVCINFVPLLHNLGETKKSGEMATVMADRAVSSLDYYVALMEKAKQKDKENYLNDVQDDLVLLNRLQDFYKGKDKVQEDKYNKLFEKYYQKLKNMGLFSE
ncbi:MAG: DUF2723 domain-containing protein, partial [Verrucomicrobia bacterium]|nr:DUF2723 domain-containing protein [Cytophagales bacterium]